MFLWVRNHNGLLILLFLFLVVVCFVDPVREVAVDDDWAYALTVRNLLETGQYRLHDWATANMPVQIYLGAFFTKILGYSFAALRFSTLVLILVGLVGFYLFLRDFGSDDTEASLLTLALLASPLILLFSFSFMTNVQFLTWFILALWLYTRAIRQENYISMFLASICASFAICTRQFGVTLPLGLFAVWMVDKQRLRDTPLYTVGLLLPILAVIWQIWFRVSNPTLFMIMATNRELVYLRDYPNLIVEFLWRPSVILQYLGLFLLPLLPLYVLLILKSCDFKKRLWLLIAWSSYIILGVSYGYVMRGALMPSIPYNLAAHLGRGGPLITVPLTVLTGAIAILLGWIFSRRYLDRYRWRMMLLTEKFLVLTVIAQLVVQLIFVHMNDEYLIVFLPFTIFVLGRELRSWPRRWKTLTAMLCLVALMASALWTRVILERKEAYWQAAEAVYSIGVKPEKIYVSAGAWNSYYGAFEEWRDWMRSTDQEVTDWPYSFFSEWLSERKNNAIYWIVDPYSSDVPVADKRWAVLDKIGYRWFDFSERYVYIYERQ